MSLPQCTRIVSTQRSDRTNAFHQLFATVTLMRARAFGGLGIANASATRTETLCNSLPKKTHIWILNSDFKHALSIRGLFTDRKNKSFFSMELNCMMGKPTNMHSQAQLQEQKSTIRTKELPYFAFPISHTAKFKILIRKVFIVKT